MADEHPAAAVSLNAEVIEDLLGILAISDRLLVLLVDVGDDLATTPTPHWNQHILTHLYDFCHFLRAPRPI